MDKIIEYKKSIETQFNDIIKTETKDEELLKKLEDLISKDNTNQQMLLKYLKLYSRLFKKEDSKNLIIQYSGFLSLDLIKSNFGEYKINKISAISLFESLFKKVMDYNPKMNLDNKIDFYNDFTKISMKISEINNYITYSNSELYIGFFYNYIIASISKNIEAFGENEENAEAQLYTSCLDEEIKIFNIHKKLKENNNYLKTLKLEDKILYEKYIKENKINDDNNNIDKKISEFENLKSFIYKISNNLFNEYFLNLSRFFKGIKKQFYERFAKLDIYGKKEDFCLFGLFCFYLSHHQFQILSKKDINYWAYCLKENKDQIIKLLNENSFPNINNYFIKEDELILKVYNSQNKKISIYKVRNISNYVIPYIIEYLSLYYDQEEDKIQNASCLDKILDICSNYTCKNIEEESKFYDIEEYIIDEFRVEQYLKIDSYQNNIFLKKKWDIWKKFLVTIFTSNVIKSVLKKLNRDIFGSSEIYDFLNERDLMKIFENVKFYPFPIKGSFAISLFPLYETYQYYKGFNPNYGTDNSKLLALSFNVINNEHELLGHLDIRIQNLLLRKDMKSPYINSWDEEKKRRESGEFIENLLYGTTISDLKYNQMLFILDEKNYNCTYEDFKLKFLKCTNKFYQPSQSLKNLLSNLGIKLEKNSQNLSDIYSIGKISKNPEIFSRGKHHQYRNISYSPKKYEEHFKTIREGLKKLREKKKIVK